MCSFSIAMPVLNGGESLKRAVGSIRVQGDEDVEVLLQDGGSTDGSREWAAERAGVSFSGERDSGMYEAINRGWARSGGSLLGHLNADEQYLPGALSRVRETFAAYPRDPSVEPPSWSRTSTSSSP